MGRNLSRIFLVAGLFCPAACLSSEPQIAIRLDAYRERRTTRASPRLFSLPPEEWRERYESESIVYVPGEVAHIRIEVPKEKEAGDAEIAVLFLVSGERVVLYRGAMKPGTYGPYEVSITSDFEVFQARVRAGNETTTKSFYGIRPWRGMRDFSEAISSCQIRLSYEEGTPWERAAQEGLVAPETLDLNWARASHVENPRFPGDEWWLWTHYACGLVGMEEGRTGLFWGEYNPWIYAKLKGGGDCGLSDNAHASPLFFETGALETETILPNGIYFREAIRPMLQKWAENLSEKYPDLPLTISLDHVWGIGQDMGGHFDPEILRNFVSWMKEQFGVSIEANTFKELIEKCRQYPRQFDYFVARYTTIRSLELTCDAVGSVVGGAKAWDRNAASSTKLMALPEAAEFCQILSRCIGVGTSDDQAAWRLSDGNPVPHGLSKMVVKALAPEQNFSVGWNGCRAKAAEGEIYRWYLEDAWLTAYDMDGKLRHVYTHSPPRGADGVWRSLIEESHASDDKIRAHDKSFQLMEAIGVEKPIGPVFVCKDWTFADDGSGRAFRSDLYEKFLTSLRRHKVPISCAVHADHEPKLPPDLPRVYAPRMNGSDEIAFSFRAGPVKRWFACKGLEIPDSLVADLAFQLNSASGWPVIFEPNSSVEGYAFEAKGMKFVVAEETSGRSERAEIKVKVGRRRRAVIEMVSGEGFESRQEGEYLVFETGLAPKSAALYCIGPGEPNWWPGQLFAVWF